jgi:multiple sugar transport system permease protein
MAVSGARPLATTSRSSHRTSARRLWRRWRGLVLVMPWLVGFLAFDFIPFIASFLISLTDWNVAADPEFVGLANYRELLFEDELLRQSVVNTLYYAVFHVVGTIVLSFLAAQLLNQQLRALPLWRTMYYLPSVTTGVATAVVWIWLLQPAGLVNQALGLIGIPGPNWLLNTIWAMPSLILISYWNIGSPMVIFLAGLQGVPQTLYEAAEVDGAGPIGRFFHITVPLMTPYIFLILILQVIGSFQVFTQALVMTDGGPAHSTTFVMLLLYWAGWQWMRMGYAAAIAWVLLAGIMAMTVIQFTLARRWVYYEAETRK